MTVNCKTRRGLSAMLPSFGLNAPLIGLTGFLLISCGGEGDHREDGGGPTSGGPDGGGVDVSIFDASLPFDGFVSAGADATATDTISSLDGLSAGGIDAPVTGTDVGGSPATDGALAPDVPFGQGPDGASGGAVFVRGTDIVLVTQVVGPDGGTLAGPNNSPISGVSVTFPAGALETDTEISLGYNSGVLQNTVGMWSGFIILLKSAGATEFAQPVSFTVPVADTTAIVRPYFIDDGGELHPIQAAQTDQVTGFATFVTFHASEYTHTLLPSGTCFRDLPSSMGTTFVPSRNGLTFGNTRDYLPAGSPGADGICTGMTNLALWWFEHPGNGAKSRSSLRRDCEKTLALKAHAFVSNRFEQVNSQLINYKWPSRSQFCDVASALKDSGKPVILSLKGSNGAHSVLATGYTPTTDAQKSACHGDFAIHVYDPNIGTRDAAGNFIPSNEQIICYDSGSATWQPYQSGSDTYDNIWLHGDGSVRKDFTGWSCGPEGGWGDPHLYTFDGLHFDFQRVGEFVLAQCADGMSVQVRLAPYNGSKRISTIVAVAADVNGNRVEINARGAAGPELWVNDVLSSSVELSRGGAVSLSGFIWPDGTQLDVIDRGGRLDIQLHDLVKSGVRGLLGNANGDANDEFALRDGTVLRRPLDKTGWASFTRAWRISNAESLFHYEAGQDTSTFTDLSFPDAVANATDLSSAVYAAAQAACLAAGVSDQAVLEACILDVGMTGDTGFATDAALIPSAASAEPVVPPDPTSGTGGIAGLPQGAITDVLHGGAAIYSVTLQSGQTIQLRAVSRVQGAFMPKLDILDSAGKVLGSAYDSRVAALSYTAATSANYTVVVSDASGKKDSAADYDFYFAVVPGSNEGGALVAGTSVTGAIDLGDIDSFTLFANAGEGLQLRFVDTDAGSMMPRLALYDPAGKLLDEPYDQTVAALERAAPTTGTYTVLLYDVSGGHVGTGKYTLYFDRVPASNKGGQLTPATPVAGTIDLGEVDSYTFVANAGEGLQLRFVDTDAGPMMPRLALYDPAGKLLDEPYDQTVAALERSAPTTGTYTVLLYDVSGGHVGTGKYTLYFDRVPASNKGGLLTPATPVTGTIDLGEVDSYTFVASAGEGLQLRFVDTDAGAMMPRLALYDPAGNLLDEPYDQTVAALERSAPTTGTYTVLLYDVSGGHVGTGKYTLYFDRVPASNKGGLLTPATPVTGTIDLGEVDSYTFVANAGEGLQLRFVDTDAGVMMPRLALYDPAGKLLDEPYDQTVAALERAAPTTGTYTVLLYDVSGGHVGTGKYTLYFDRAPGSNKGGLLTPATSITGTIDLGEVDSYTFVANAGAAIQLRLVDSDAGAMMPRLALYDPAGKLLDEPYDQTTVTLSRSAATSGTYTVLIYDVSGGHASTGRYELSLAISGAAP